MIRNVKEINLLPTIQISALEFYSVLPDFDQTLFYQWNNSEISSLFINVRFHIKKYLTR